VWCRMESSRAEGGVPLGMQCPYDIDQWRSHAGSGVAHGVWRTPGEAVRHLPPSATPGAIPHSEAEDPAFSHRSRRQLRSLPSPLHPTIPHHIPFPGTWLQRHPPITATPFGPEAGTGTGGGGRVILP
jgi:hypothetical protein